MLLSIVRTAPRRRNRYVIGRYDEVTRLFDRLYEDSLSGHISNENFTRLIGKYQSEQERLQTEIPVLKDSLSLVKENRENAVKWAELMAPMPGYRS